MPVATDKGGGDFQLPKPGTEPARCVQIIDLGTQTDVWPANAPPGKGKTKFIRRVRIGWELPNQKATFDEERGEESFMVGVDYTLSLGERANLRHVLESWRGHAFTADELKGFDLKVLLGKACLLNIIIQESKNKRHYAQIASVTPLPKGMQCPKATLPKVLYDIEMGQNEVFKALPEWIQDRIKLSQEFTTEPGSANLGPQEPGDDDDEIPF